jgi:hypothetical protein
MIGKFNVLVKPKGSECNKKQNCSVVNSVLTLKRPVDVFATFLITQQYRTRIPLEC